MGDVVGVRGLVLDGMRIGGVGIQIDRASAVHIQNCVIRNYEGGGPDGILVSGTTNLQLFVSDTLIYNNGSVAASGGIIIQPVQNASVNINVVLDRVHLENNVRGLWVDGSHATGTGIHVILRDSVVSGNAGEGILATSAPNQAAAFIVVERTSAVNNGGTGILANGPHATMLLKENMVTRNAVGINAVNGGQLISYGNNSVNNNLGLDGVPTGSYSPI